MYPNYTRFTLIPQGVFSFPGCTRQRLDVYSLLLIRSGNGKRQAYGGRISISKKLSIAQSTIQEALLWLEENHLIKKSWQSWGGRGMANCYRVVVAGFRAVKTFIASSAVILTDHSVTKKTLLKEKRDFLKNREKKPPPPEWKPQLDGIRNLRTLLKSL